MAAYQTAPGAKNTDAAPSSPSPGSPFGFRRAALRNLARHEGKLFPVSLEPQRGLQAPNGDAHPARRPGEPTARPAEPRAGTGPARRAAGIARGARNAGARAGHGRLLTGTARRRPGN